MDEYVKEALEAYQPDDPTGPAIIQQAIADTWMGTFIYKFFIEDADLRQSVIDFVIKHRPGTNPRFGDPYRHGSYNFIIEIILDDGIVLFRFPVPGLAVYPDDKVKAEVATIRYVADNTTIPVPHIYHWGTAGENPTGLNVPFIIMDHIPHATTVGQALEDPEFQIPSIPESEKREYLYEQMAEISLQLYSLTSDRIGSLGVLGNGEYGVTSAPLSQHIAYQVINCDVPVAVLPPRDRTYSSSADYLADAADIEISGLLFMNEKFFKSATDCRDKFVARYLVRHIVRRRHHSTGEFDHSRPHAEVQTEPPRETFRLWGDDFRPENVLLAEKGAVVGVVDWEYTYFAPETYHLNPPWWLLLEFVDEYMDKDAESSTSDRDALSHNAENAEDGEGAGKFREQWDELVRSQGIDLCSSSSKDQAVAASIAQQPPLSQLMRHRWEEEMKEYALTTAFTQTHLLDNYFWDYIDESYWRENTLGGHEGRLELLTDPCRMLMDWFVHRRVEEKNVWEPKALLNQVLEQMDGKSWVLVVPHNSRPE